MFVEHGRLPTHGLRKICFEVGSRHVKLGAKLLVISSWTWRLSIERRRRGQSRRINWCEGVLEGGTVSIDCAVDSCFFFEENEGGGRRSPGWGFYSSCKTMAFAHPGRLICFLVECVMFLMVCLGVGRRPGTCACWLWSFEKKKKKETQSHELTFLVFWKKRRELMM